MKAEARVFGCRAHGEPLHQRCYDRCGVRRGVWLEGEDTAEAVRSRWAPGFVQRYRGRPMDESRLLGFGFIHPAMYRRKDTDRSITCVELAVDAWRELRLLRELPTDATFFEKVSSMWRSVRPGWSYLPVHLAFGQDAELGIEPHAVLQPIERIEIG